MNNSALKKRHGSVGVVIVNRNTQEWLLSAVSSFASDGINEADIVVVDQGSSDGSIPNLKRKFRKVKTMVLPENRSYSAAINAGVVRLDAEFLIVSNADVRFERGVISELLTVMRNDQRIAVVGPRILDENGTPTTRFSRTGMLRAALLLLVPRLMRGWWRKTEQRSKDSNQPFPVSWVEGCFMLIRRSAFEELGGFDESFSFFFEDGDLAIRLLKLGYKMYHCPQVAITHGGGASFTQVPDKTFVEFYENCLRFYRKHLCQRSRWLRRLLILVLKLKAWGRFKDGESVESQRALLRMIIGDKARIEGPVLPDTPLVSIILPTYGRVDCLVKLLDSLKYQTYQKYEIIVVDQSEMVPRSKMDAFRRYGRKLTLVRSDRKNRCSAKNIGIHRARGDLLLFLDDDTLPEKNLLETHCRAYGDQNVGAVSCRVIEPLLPASHSDNIQRITKYGRMIVGFQSDRTCFVGTLAGQNMSIPRIVQEHVGEFDVSLAGTSIFEEPDFSARVRHLGFKILFTNKSTVQHLPQASGNDGWKSREPSLYYHWFHHNEILYFLKNHSRFNLLMVVPFCVLRTAKQSLKFHLSGQEAWFMFKGALDGFRTYYRLYR